MSDDVFTGTHQERLARVMDVRDAIRGRLEAWLEALSVQNTPGTRAS